MSCSNSAPKLFISSIDEHTLLYAITSLTFLIIGGFLFIKSQFTFFEKHKLPRGKVPSIPFGNLKNVLNRQNALFVHLWKYYNRFKRKGYQCAGLYMFFKPSVVLVDPLLIQKFNDAGRRNLVAKEELTKIILASSTENRKLFEEGSGNNVEEILHQFFFHRIFKIVGINEDRKLFGKLNHKFSCGYTNYFCMFYTWFKKNNNKTLEELSEEIINDRKKNDVRKMDLFQLIIDGKAKLNSEELAEILSDYFQFSYSTSLFLLHEISKNTEIQDELIGEIRRFQNKSSDNNLEELVYLDTAIKETFRKYPPCAMVLKTATEDVRNKEGTWIIPRGCLVFILPYALHHDQSNYTDAEKFDPDRFSEENLRFIKNGSYMPFGQPDLEIDFISTLVKLAIIEVLKDFKISNTGTECLQLDPNVLNPHPVESLKLQFTSL